MSNNKRQKLINLGPETLADALLKLAARHADAEDMIERMLATPAENIKRFKAKLAELKRMQRFIEWRESSDFARELETLLEALKDSITDPRTGVELVVAFYETANVVFNHCDDSSGHIGNVYSYDARNLFVHYASRCEDKEWLVDLVLKLNREDDFGIHNTLFECAKDYLPETAIRKLIDRLWIVAEKETDDYRRRRWLLGIEFLARQLKDGPLFEKARLTSWPELSTAACVDIAQVYMDSGDAQTALTWLDRIQAGETYMAHERDRLLLTIYKALDNREKAAETAWRIFRGCRSEKTLATLLEVIGEDQRDRVLDDEAQNILQTKRLSYTDAAFLMNNDQMNEAENYILERADQLNGGLYGSLLPLAEHMEKAGRFLAASVIYRALLDSILQRAQSKYYHHGVRYLRKLDQLAPQIDNWQNMQSHAEYGRELHTDHARKRSFWSKYGASA